MNTRICAFCKTNTAVSGFGLSKPPRAFCSLQCKNWAQNEEWANRTPRKTKKPRLESRLSFQLFKMNKGKK